MVDELIVKPWKLFLDSFRKMDVKIVQAAFFDLLYYFVILLTYLLAVRLAGNVLNAEFIVGESLAPIISSMIFTFLLIIVLLFANIVVFKNLVWNRTAGRKIGFLDFLKLTAATIIPLAVIFFAISLSVVPSTVSAIVLLVLLLISAYLIAVSRAVYDGNVKKAIIKTVEVGIFKFYKFIVPFVLMLIVFSVLSILTSFLIQVNDAVFFSITTIVFVLFFAWTRFYFLMIVQSGEEKKKKTVRTKHKKRR
jgi:hypothetical protein